LPVPVAIVTDAAGSVTRTRHEAVRPLWAFAVTVAVPTAWAVTVPSCATVAAALLSLDHSIVL